MSRCTWGRSGFFLLTRTLGDEQRRAAGGDAFGGDGYLAHVIAARQLEHNLRHHFFENGAQPSGAGAALHRLRRDRLQRVLLECETHILEVEQLLVLLGERVLGLGEDPDERFLIERVERHGDRQAAHELGYEPVAQQVVRLDVHERVLLQLLGDAFGDLFLGKADLPSASAGLDDLLSPSNAPPQMKRMSLVLTWMYSCCGCLRPPCGGTLATVPSRILSSACCTPSPETSRVMLGFSDFSAILSISSI